ncbi:SixA phosphatase family protein [Microlunatus parietis]|uniref:Phosphohistidine phosphatase n=1 Tax=Microlunatus parietis TaxID=682979 RepID=A0A7Y9I634_9ACTN|nr:histidine phosphatase family protein [Microlunatus parietis]NYE70808.1 phosphohistidine phosphatase [Microlunatus parietis]
MISHRLLLLRHATTEDFRPGFADRDRRLTEQGVREAAEVGAWLREQGVTVDRVLCSSAVRTRQTLDGLGLTAPAEFADSLYSGGSETILESVRVLDEDVRTALVIGHSPAVPGAVRDLADPETSDPDSLITLDRRYPPATLSVLEFSDPWSNLITARLALLRLP